jgi:hypothetical protein
MYFMNGKNLMNQDMCILVMVEEFLLHTCLVYSKVLQEFESANLSRVIESGCVTVGNDMEGFSVIAFIPTLGFDYGEKSEETLHLIYLLFIRQAHPIVTSGPYSIVYSRKSVDWRKPLVYDYYQMLSEKDKKNLRKLYVISPQIGIRMFFTITRMFLSAEFHSKLVFVENIAEFQRVVPLITKELPAKYAYKLITTCINTRPTYIARITHQPYSSCGPRV